MQVGDATQASITAVYSISAPSANAALQPPVFDQPILPDDLLQGLLQVQDLHRLQGLSPASSSCGVTEYLLYPACEGQAWDIVLYDLSESVEKKPDDNQTKLFFILEGKLTVKVDAVEKELQPGQAVRVHAGSSYQLRPVHGGCRLLCLSMQLPYSMPECGQEPCSKAVFADHDIPQVPSQLGILQKQHFSEICVNGANAAYDLIEGKIVGGRYNVSILDIVRARKHYHERETERRIVVGGNLEVELDNTCYSLTFGQMCRISPMVVHRFTSKDPSSPTRLFAINIPAYDPANVKLAE